MNDRSDFDRVLVRWFDDGPSVIPDRVVDVVAERISRRRQRRSWRVLGRSTNMNLHIKLIAAVAAFVILAVAGWNLLPNTGGFGGRQTAAPSVPPLPDGKLHAGEYAMRAVTADPMAFLISAPEGWQGLGGFFLGGPKTAGAPDGIGISVNHDPEVVSKPCDSAAHTRDPGTSPPSIDDVVAAISSRPDLQVSGVADAVLAGYQGKRLDIQFPTTLLCEQQYVFAEPKGLYANGPGNRWRVWLLDVDGQTAVVVLLDYSNTPARDRTAAEAAIASIRITP